MKKYKAAFKKIMWDTVEDYNNLSYEETKLKTQGSMSTLNGCLIRMAAVLGGTPIYKSVEHPVLNAGGDFISYTVVTGIAITKER